MNRRCSGYVWGEQQSFVPELCSIAKLGCFFLQCWVLDIWRECLERVAWYSLTVHEWVTVFKAVPTILHPTWWLQMPVPFTTFSHELWWEIMLWDNLLWYPLESPRLTEARGSAILNPSSVLICSEEDMIVIEAWVRGWTSICQNCLMIQCSPWGHHSVRRSWGSQTLGLNLNRDGFGCSTVAKWLRWWKLRLGTPTAHLPRQAPRCKNRTHKHQMTTLGQTCKSL